jgi:hemolysin activation/secretion protein
LNGSIRYDNLWQRDHSISLSFQVSPENTEESRVLSGTYVIPANGDYWALYAVVSKSDVSAVGDVNIIGNGEIYGVRFIHPLPALENFSHSLTLGADYKDFQETTALQGADSFNTPISYLPFTLGYDATWLHENSSSQLNLGFNFSMRGLGNDELEFSDKRSLAKPNYAYLRMELKHTQQLYKGWQLSANLAGQVTDQPLISNEQFAIGGADTVRGYRESNALGDTGGNGIFELRSPSLARYFPEHIQELRALAFYDIGHVRVFEPLPAQTAKFNLAAVGLGLRLKGRHGIFGDLDYARALRSAGTGAEDVQDGDARWHIRVGYDW